MEKMLFSTISPARQKLLLRVSGLLNLLLLLYLSLSAGWSVSSVSSVSPGAEILAQDSASHQTFSRGILNKYFEDSSPEDLKSPVVTTESKPSLSSSAFVSTFSVAENLNCYNQPIEFHQGMRNKYWVLYNYVRAEKVFNCNESMTYTTHGDFSFLDNLEPLLERWQGPISVSVYAPGSDLDDTLDSILYFRDCTESDLVRHFATFHVFFDMGHIPASVPRHTSLLKKRLNCEVPEGLDPNRTETTYRHRLGLDYPVNVARNVARLSAATHFVFPSDIELYPSPNLINDFLSMVKRNPKELQRKQPRVFVNSIFEIAANHSLPNNKAELVTLLNSNTVIPFHKTVCPQCHKIPKAIEWPAAEIKPGMNVFYVGKRMKPFQHWEPIYIGTNQEPLYDERLSWEGRSDKMAQGFKLCLLNYEFQILDNAFLIHRPGIKTKKSLQSSLKKKKISAQNDYLKKTILPEIKKLYGARKGCEMF